MSDYGPLGITNFITPYDLCILILIHVHCSQDNGIAAVSYTHLDVYKRQSDEDESGSDDESDASDYTDIDTDTEAEEDESTE